MDKKLVDELIKKIEESSLSCFEYEDDDFKIRLEKNPAPAAAPAVVVPAAEIKEAKPVQSEKTYVKAPIVGTFYKASSPDMPPFVKIGDSVSKGDVVCIVEAMKLFNEVTSDYSGTVKEILVADGDMVEFDQPLMLIE